MTLSVYDNPSFSRPLSPVLRTGGLSAITSEQSSATFMPTQRQTTAGIEPLMASPKISAEQSSLALSQIRSKKQAPSAILTEQFLMARALLNPGYVHNSAATRAENISNLYKQTPRFHSQVDILA